MNIPKYFFKDKKYKKSKAQEDRVAKKLSGRRQPGSGSKPMAKGDVKCKEVLVECKRTDKKSISITLAVLEKISKEAHSYDRAPALTIEFDKTPAYVERDWVMITSDFFSELMEIAGKE